MSLPDRIAPMLAASGEPFDSYDHVFELKWDGIRCMAFRDDDGTLTYVGRVGSATERRRMSWPCPETPGEA